MKNDELKSLAKSARKSAAADIESALLVTLKKAAAKLGQGTKHFDKEIKKGAAKLAKKLSKEMEFNDPEKLETKKLMNETGKPVKVVNGAGKPQSVAKIAVKAATPAQNTAPAVKAAPKANNISIPAAKQSQPAAAVPSKPATKKK